jgi:hypothetical protein
METKVNLTFSDFNLKVLFPNTIGLWPLIVVLFCNFGFENDSFQFFDDSGRAGYLLRHKQAGSGNRNRKVS